MQPTRRSARSFARPLILGAAAVAISLTAGCGGNKGGQKDTAYVARDVESLYSAAKQRLDRGDYKIAAALFDEVERQHPYSPWARRAQLMSAFSYYVGRDYNKSVQASQRFLSIHPGNKDAPYAYYLIALCYYEQISDVQRDQAITDQALTALTEVNRRFPRTDYAADARIKLDLVNDHLAGKDMEIGRFYEKTGKWLAAQLRFQNVVEKYSTTSHAPEALYRLTETSLSLGVPREAQRYAAVLGANYPGSEWYQKAFDLMDENAHWAVAGVASAR
ncbi:MAG: outer membrane protein assembly factor BamD [Candidatus Andeanibacterium colombiense]|uniref:Outer membrane protein assembly factor BamD n=1 Tax=Candidatus Andeanibacterium colombiense TaxID=3121345 RepID=A0AAJ5XAM0_9SPHN|nr:MAG: outer membrane protein assembly factor BamD [Sphingomonadaceae bacterium]